MKSTLDDLPERLAHAPVLPRITSARASLAEAVAALEAAERAVVAATTDAGQAIGEALRHRGLLEGQQKSHRHNPSLLTKAFDGLPGHLARSFTRDSHYAFQMDQSSFWEKWKPSTRPQGLTAKGKPGQLLRWGTHDPRDGDKLLFSVLPLIGSGKPWVILSDDESDKRARELLRAITLRLACTLPQQSKFTFLDPLAGGKTFPMQRDLPVVRETTADLAQDLQPIQADVRRIIKDVVGFHGSFESLPAEQQAAERYEFIIAADFPRAKAYDRRVSEILFDIGRTGPTAGRYLILHANEGQPLPYEISLDQLGDMHRIDLRRGAGACADVSPPAELQKEILRRVREAASVRQSVDFDAILPSLSRSGWWKGESTRRIETTLDGRKGGLEIVFGHTEDDSELVHGMLVGATGYGKSNLLHAMLLGLATRYPPEELQFFLMDLKQGVEFEPYSRLPHAAVVAYNTHPALARAVLSELRSEMDRRLVQLFRPAGVHNLEEYRNKGQPNGPAPRVLLIVDEYQGLFSGPDAQSVSGNLQELSKQGRAAGIHMLLASQDSRPAGMQHSDLIFNNIRLRLAMSVPHSTAQVMTEFEREGKDLIRKCDRKGMVVVNHNAGRDGSNRLGQVVKVAAEDREHVLTELQALAGAWTEDRRRSWPRTQVFDGREAPSLAEHSLRVHAARCGQPIDTGRLASWAATRKADGGLARMDWRSSDGPVPLLLGREYAVHGDAACVLRRLPNQNLLLLGTSTSARLGMLSGIVASVHALGPDVLGAVRVVDLSGDPAIASVLASGGERLSVVTDPAQAVAALDSAANGGSELLILIEPDRAKDLLLSTDPIARSSATDALERRLRDGPPAGRHTVLVCTGFPAFKRVLGRRGQNSFTWRAVTQISQEDSQDLLGNRRGSQLGTEGGGGPEAALLADMEGDRFTPFMPYGS